MRKHLHIVRTDVLLWALAGFAEPGTMDRDWRIAVIKGFTGHRWPYGSVIVLAGYLGISRNYLSVAIHRMRVGRQPKAWSAVAPAPRETIAAILAASSVACASDDASLPIGYDAR